MNKKLCFIILILIITFTTAFCNDKNIKVMVALNENVPGDIKEKACDILSKCLNEHNISIISFPKEKLDCKEKLINSLMEGNDGKLLQVARDEGTLFLICGNLHTMKTGTTTIYETILNEMEVFGEIKLFLINPIKKNQSPLLLSLQVKEKGLSVQIQESYQQALGKALDSIGNSIASTIKP